MNKKDKKIMHENVECNDDLNLWVLLEQTFFVMARNRDLELKHYGLTPAQAFVLFTLIKNNGQAIENEIAELTIRQHPCLPFSTILPRGGVLQYVPPQMLALTVHFHAINFISSATIIYCQTNISFQQRISKSTLPLHDLALCPQLDWISKIVTTINYFIDKTVLKGL